ncbi:MAG: subtilisin-like proprotein convertase family protein, partial [Myxococcota bacterium]
DGDADSLASLGCADGQRPGWDAAREVWTCADDLVLDAVEVRTIVEALPLDLAPGTTIGGAVPVSGAVAWADLLGVPAGLLDGDDDALASLVCLPGQVLAYDAEGFGCADPAVASDTLADLGFFCDDAEIPVWDAADRQWVCGPDRTLEADDLVLVLGGADLDLGAGTTIGGEPIVTGAPFTAEDAIDAVRGAGGVDEGLLPFNGLDEVSNGLLTNQFIDGFSAGPIPIPDNNPLGASQVLAVPDIGIAEWLTVTVELENSDTTGVRLELEAPDGAVIVLFDGEEPGVGFTKTWPDPDPTVSGDLTAWVGRNPVGDWTLTAIDTLYLDNEIDGAVVRWSVDLQTVSTERLALGGALSISDGLSVDADLLVGGDLTVRGSSTLEGATDVRAALDVAGRVSANIGVMFGDTEDPCDESTEGLVRYAGGYLRVCDGIVWRSISMDADGSVRGLAARNCTTLHDLSPTLPSGAYWIDPNGGLKEDAFQTWCDMERDGGGWTLALQNVGTVPTTDPAPLWDATVNQTVVRGGALAGTLDGFDILVGLSFWEGLGTEARIEVGATPGVPVKQAMYVNLSLDATDEYRLSMAGETITLGPDSPGIYAAHNGQRWTTTDNDNDDYPTNCADLYLQPWWYTSCWSGNLWGSEIGYTTNAYWAGSGPDHHNWGALWLRE